MQSIGSKILAAAREKHPKGYHPRIMMTEADFARLRENKDQGLTKNIVAKVIEMADSFLDQPPRGYEIPDGLRLLGAARSVQQRLFYLSYAYRITGEEKYAERAVAEIHAAAAFPDWNPRSFLGCGELCLAFAIAYDWLYDYLSEEIRAEMREALIEKGLERVMEEYTDAPEHKKCLRSDRGYRWYQDKPGDNWKMVCNGSVSLAALAIFDESDCDFFESLLTYAFDDTYEAVHTFYNEADGTYSEGVNYWEYATLFLAYYSKGLMTAAGSDFGLTDWEGVRISPYFLLSLSSPDKIAFNFGDAVAVSIAFPVLSWCAERYGDSALYGVRRPDIENGRINYVDVLFFRDIEPAPLSKLPLAFGSVSADNAAFRTDISSDAFYAAIHLAPNHAYHGHRDMGTFVMNIGEKRFFVDLGPDDYNLRPYRDSYRFRAEGHNTLIMNPAPENDQARVANCTVNRFAAEGDSFAIGDMSEAFPGKTAIRGMKMLRESGSVILQDEIECSEEDVIRWSAHTPASVRLYESGKAALLDIDGTRMYVALLADGCFAVSAAAPDENSPIPAPAEYVSGPRPQAVNHGIQKLTVTLKGKGSHRIAVWFKPLSEGEEIPAEKPAITPLALW